MTDERRGDDSTPAGNGDLAAVLGALVVVDAVVLAPGLSSSPLRLAVVLPVLLFVPGYAVVAALFPEDRGVPSARPAADPRLGLLGRVVLGFGASVGVVAAVALTLDFTAFGFQLVPLLAGVTLLTLVVTGVAWARRRAVPAARRAGVTGDALDGLAAFVVGDRRRDRVLTAVAVGCVLLAAGAVYAAPSGDGSDLSVSLLAENGNGTLAADDYPESLVQGEPVTLNLAVRADGDRPTAATVVVRLQSVAVNGTDVRVTSQRTLDRFTVRVGAGGTRVVEHTITPTVPGERLRLAYHVYRGASPQDTSPGAADRQVHLWVSVRASG